MTPESHLLGSMKNTGELEEVKHPMSYRSSPLKSTNNSKMYQYEPLLPTLDKAGQHRQVLQEWRPISHGRSKKQPVVLKARADRDPFNPLSVNSTSKKIRPSQNLQFMRTPREVADLSTVLTGYRFTIHMWIIVVDTACLLNKKSRKELQLLQGLRGTTLVIPRIVVRELDCMLRRGSFFTRMTEVSAALQWIEECMAVAKWWIHIQSSADESQLIPPTPPASPHWSSEDKGAFPVGSISFSPYCLQEIVTPTAADHILECALFFKQTRKNGQLVLLSDDVTLKIKAMAEGVICETAQEFRGSLVNPFSLRFLYSDSSPVGPTWSCVDDVVLKEKYYPSPSKKLSKSGEGAKGLKLILLHNSKFRQINPVSPNPLAENRSLISNLGSN
ncbi:UNVERIFIED_CONTAM: FHA domain-containing protein PS1 [Sesamum radiatum]|uniref:FHA domain-containing protein PS1 n=1 Tax=Sesamum radiatum TaxID=300843 RepID=A0AAW2M483_SESRA